MASNKILSELGQSTPTIFFFVDGPPISDSAVVQHCSDGLCSYGPPISDSTVGCNIVFNSQTAVDQVTNLAVNQVNRSSGGSQ